MFTSFTFSNPLFLRNVGRRFYESSDPPFLWNVGQENPTIRQKGGFCSKYGFMQVKLNSFL